MKRKNKFILGTAGLALSLIGFGVGVYGLNTKTASADSVNVGIARTEDGRVIESGGAINEPFVYSVDTQLLSYIEYQKPNSDLWEKYHEDTVIDGVEGWYSFRVKGFNAGEEPYRVYYDVTAPLGCVFDAVSAKGSGSVTSNSYVKYQATDSGSGIDKMYVYKPNSTVFEEYTDGTLFTENGTYLFKACDKAGNVTETIHEITLNLMQAQLYVDDEPVESGSYTNGEYVQFVSNGICFVKKPGTSYFTVYDSGMELEAEGRYEFYATDEVGEKTETYVVIVDREAVTGMFTKVTYANWYNYRISWLKQSPDTTAPVVRVTVNGYDYEFDSIVYTLAGKQYDVVIYDAAGNTWSGSFTGGSIDIPTITLQQVYWEYQDIFTGEYSAFNEYESAISSAVSRERALCEFRYWETEAWDQGIAMDLKDSVNAKNGRYYLYKSEENPDKQVAYFTEERLNEVCRKYASENVKSYYYWEKEPVGEVDYKLDAYSGQNKVVGKTVELREGLKYTLDGEEYTELTITKPGAHKLLIEDGYGGSVEYDVTILGAPPTLQYALGENTPVRAGFNRTYYLGDKVTLSIPLELDEMAMFAVYSDGELLGYYDVGTECVIEESGSYTAKAMNHYGITKEFTFVISMNSPAIAVNKDEAEELLDINIADSVDREANITYIEIAKSTDGGRTWGILTEDDFGTTIAVDVLHYSFESAGLYKITVTDEFRTGIDAITETVSFKQDFIDNVGDEWEDGNNSVDDSIKDNAVEKADYSELLGGVVSGVVGAVVVSVVVVLILKRRGVI